MVVNELSVGGKPLDKRKVNEIANNNHTHMTTMENLCTYITGSENIDSWKGNASTYLHSYDAMESISIKIILVRNN